VSGCTFSREIDWVTRVRCWSLILTDALTLVDEDCAVFEGWLVDCVGCCAVVFCEGCCAVVFCDGCWAVVFWFVGACCA
jgi:hypothetical protein